jgi:outer membrane protein W
MLRTSCVAIVALGIASSAAGAQPPGWAMSYGIFSYEASIPSGDLDSYIGDASWLGLTMEAHKRFRPNATVGFEFGWNVYHDKQGGTTELAQGAVTGNQYRNVNQFPMLVTSRFYGGEGKSWHPFAGVGVGAYYTRQILDFGVNEYTATEWQFGFAPEIGVLTFTPSHTAVQFRVRYNYPISSGDFLGGGGRSFNNFSFGIGVGGVW